MTERLLKELWINEIYGKYGDILRSNPALQGTDYLNRLGYLIERRKVGFSSSNFGDIYGIVESISQLVGSIRFNDRLVTSLFGLRDGELLSRAQILYGEYGLCAGLIIERFPKGDLDEVQATQKGYESLKLEGKEKIAITYRAISMQVTRVSFGRSPLETVQTTLIRTDTTRSASLDEVDGWLEDIVDALDDAYFGNR